MKIWIDAQLSPAIAPWLEEHFGVSTYHLRDLGLRDASDREIFQRAKAESCVVMSKDQDFRELLEQYGPPPQIIWLTCGNTSNERFKEILSLTFEKVLTHLRNDEPLVEIGDAQ